MDILKLIITFLHTPLGWTVSGFLILFVINKIFSAKPGWAKYEGWMISAVKFAEKAIPDDAENGGLAKANSALQYFIESYRKAKGKEPSKKLVEQVNLGLPIVHDKLEHMMKRKEEVKKGLAA